MLLILRTNTKKRGAGVESLGARGEDAGFSVHTLPPDRMVADRPAVGQQAREARITRLQIHSEGPYPNLTQDYLNLSNKLSILSLYVDI